MSKYSVGDNPILRGDICKPTVTVECLPFALNSYTLDCAASHQLPTTDIVTNTVCVLRWIEFCYYCVIEAESKVSM